MARRAAATGAVYALIVVGCSSGNDEASTCEGMQALASDVRGLQT
ncbi:MAG: hypothetical protein ACRDH7_16950 [Actinomycetota bacterium]